PPIPTGTEVSGCEGTPVTLGAGIWLAYQWSTGETSPTIQVSTAGNYAVTIYNQYLCSSNYNIGVYFNPLVIAEFSSSVTGGVATFTNMSQHEWTNNYGWDFGDGNSSTEENPVHTYAVSGDYEVSLTVENECGEDSYTSMVVVTLGIDSEDAYPFFTIFPNPANDLLNFTCPSSASGWMAEILDVSGRSLLVQTLASDEQAVIMVEELAAGSYILRLSNPNNEIIRRPFIKK
ncbi:MAG: PKD domain-containing protein, partial [Bacteroidales bacterium]|nr:PKD domain-containing protein [Bacteroidales bacterium]